MKLSNQQRQDIFNDNLVEVQIISNQREPIAMRDEVLLVNVGGQEIDSSGYHVSDLGNIEFHWGDPDINKNTVLRPSKNNVFSHSTFSDFEMFLVAENFIVIDDEEDKVNSLPQNSVFLCPSKPPRLPRSHDFEPKKYIFWLWILKFVRRKKF